LKSLRFWLQAATAKKAGQRKETSAITMIGYFDFFLQIMAF